MKLIDTGHEVARKFMLDRGVRKYSLVLISMGILSVGFLATGYFISTGAQYTSFVGGILTLYAVYCGGNVASKWSPTSTSEDVKLPDAGPGPEN